MAKNQLATLRIVIDTNVLISALIFGGKPRQILRLVLDKQVTAVISPYLLSELQDILAKKFGFSEAKLKLLERKIKQKFVFVYPTKAVTVCRDLAGNRVLEAAVEGKCNHIVTGDKDLLDLKKHHHIKIVTPEGYLKPN